MEINYIYKKIKPLYPQYEFYRRNNSMVIVKKRGVVQMIIVINEDGYFIMLEELTQYSSLNNLTQAVIEHFL